MCKKFSTRISERDLDILMAIDRTPLTAEQLCRLSLTFDTPFADVHNLRRRLRSLCKSSLLKSWPYAIATDGRSPHYYRLTRDGYRLLYGIDSQLPHRRTFEEISHGHHYHTLALADLIVHLSRTAAAAGITVQHFSRENSLQIAAGEFMVRPDCTFQLVNAAGRAFNFMIELDNGTERVRSKLDVESIERKVRAYDLHQSQFRSDDPQRYRVVFVTTRSRDRLGHILQLAGDVMKNPQRTVFVGCSLDEMKSASPFNDAILTDHRGLRKTLIPKLPFKKPTEYMTMSAAT